VTVQPNQPGDEPTTAGFLAQQLQSLLRKIIHDGVDPIITSSIAHAEDRLTRARRVGRTEHDAREAAITRIVGESIAKAGITGFTTGLGGIVTMPITLPAGIAGNFMLNARMVGSIAHLRGYDLQDPQVETMIQLIVAGLSLEKILKEFGVNLSRKVAERAVMRAAWMAIEVIPGYIINSVGVRAGYLLVIRYGTSKGAALLYKSLPIVSGVVGGALDSGFTKGIAKAASIAFV
jgi:hypothetical protein